MSWEDLDITNKPVSDEDRHEVLKLAAQFKSLFQTETGKTVLDYLERLTIQRPILDEFARSDDGQTLAILMASREGENRIVRTIKTMIRIAEEA